MTYFHELIDYSYGVVHRRDDPHEGSLVHLLFTSNTAMAQYLHKQLPSRAQKLKDTYIYRDWGNTALRSLCVVFPEA